MSRWGEDASGFFLPMGSFKDGISGCFWKHTLACNGLEIPLEIQVAVRETTKKLSFERRLLKLFFETQQKFDMLGLFAVLVRTKTFISS